jgi:hypothetical protein
MHATKSIKLALKGFLKKRTAADRMICSYVAAYLRNCHVLMIDSLLYCIVILVIICYDDTLNQSVYLLSLFQFI